MQTISTQSKNILYPLFGISSPRSALPLSGKATTKSSSTLPSFKRLENTIRIVFKHRKTKLLLPISFQEDEILRMQSFWNEYLKNLRLENIKVLPSSFLNLIEKINCWLELSTSLISNTQ